MATTTNNEDQDKVITVYVMPGSQYSAKVLVALDSHQIKHYCTFVSIMAKYRKLPSGGKMVPEMTVESSGKEDTLILIDSEKILHWINDNIDGVVLYPPDTVASELSVRISDGILGQLVLYYNWIHPVGYERSMKKGIKKTLPSFLSLVNDYLADYLTQDRRKTLRTDIAKALSVSESDLDDQDKIWRILMEELKFIQSHLKSNVEEQPYLISGATKPTAADCSAFAMIERLVGDMGDVHLPNAIPELKKEKDLDRLWQWHDLMRAKHPVQFKGKRPTKE